jgi:hypothetical protein
MKNYTIATGRNYALFEQEVERLLNAGWKLAGGVSVTLVHFDAQGNLNDTGTPAYAYWQAATKDS